ncbi:uncharacterized protein PRCAT00003033001 [Priceomyces carsonii]|uniref:uncharacterized protein n=1 Tax=Priceomyces carsonii TaxID=28549 RepID=UPI002ED84C4F|nr:unnamed protein product [Priceomyces carsonii]
MGESHLDDHTLAIETSHLTYKFSSSNTVGLEDINLQIPWGTTNLLVGPNGAGKSTLLKILAGKTLIKKGSLKLGGFDPFEFSSTRHEQHNSDINNFITYLGTDWAANSVVKRDIPVKILIASIGGETYTARRDELIDILDVDPDWSMMKISDGERRRVQICMGLLKPWRLLLLDEVTIDLDVVVRLKLLEYLKKECSERKCCVVYATHIFDGLGKKWCDRIIHLNAGSKVNDIAMEDISFQITEDNKVLVNDSNIKVPFAESLHPLALHWLAADLRERGSREDQKIKNAERLNGWNNSRDGNYFDANESKLSSYFKATRSYE